MIKYLDRFTPSLSEINNSPTLLIHGLSSCNFHCYNCLNYETIVNHIKDKYYSIQDIVSFLRLSNNLYNYIALSGGEFLLFDTSDIINDINKIRSVFAGKIIIYTNGTFPDKIKILSENNIVDGFHTDMKLPYHLLNNKEDDEVIKQTIGKSLSSFELNNLMQSIKYTVKYDKGYNQVRSVRYPFLHESAFVENQNFISELNLVYQRETPYYINDFVEKGIVNTTFQERRLT